MHGILWNPCIIFKLPRPNLPAKERELFFRQYQKKRGVDPVIAEKNFWICWLLGRIFEQPQLEDTCVFKGGTSLSKVFGSPGSAFL